MVADTDKTLRMLKTARGQIDGLIKMVEDNRYCIDISNQLMASTAILKKVNMEILHAHLSHCVKDAIGGDDAQDKIEEIMGVMDKLAK
ncbi:MAG: metal-sensing transcriptional repressor [Oscillospiraceae bacterium]